jgi:RimJ/RimL family protein N-acetyltransferase
MSIRVRPARPGDARPLVELARAVGAEPEGWLISAGEWRSVWEERKHLAAIGRSGHGEVLVAENDTGIVGRLSILRDPHPASGHVADVGLMVAAGHRREGVGTALLDAAEDWARGAGIRKLELHVFPHNEAALALYEHAGYRREGYREAHFQRSGGFVDVLLMAKMIG